MADKKISQLTAATTPLAGTEVLPIVQGGATVKVSVDNLTYGKAVNTGNLTVTGSANNLGIVKLGDATLPDPYCGMYRGNAAAPASGGNYLNLGGYEGIAFTSGAAALASQTERIRLVGSTGYVGFNVNAPATQVHIAGSTGVTLGAVANNTWRTAAIVPVDGGGAYKGGLSFLTHPSSGGAGAPTEKMKIDDVGNVTVSAGNLVIGTSGKGIDFSATPQPAGMTSELLADYEEGTWTPVLTFATPGDLSVSYTTQEATYTKVGRTVYVQFSINTSAFTYTTASGLLRLSGLPYTPSNTNNQGYGGMHVGGVSMANYTQFCPTPAAANTFAYVAASGQGQTPTYLSATQVASGSNKYMFGSFSYNV